MKWVIWNSKVFFQGHLWFYGFLSEARVGWINCKLNIAVRIWWSHTQIILRCHINPGIIWDTMPYEFQAQGFWMQISWFLARLGLYCFPIEHIFGICTTLSWHSGFPIPIQLPYLCGKKGYKPGKGKNIFHYAHSHNSIPFHRWSKNRLPLLAIIINIILRFGQFFLQGRF